MQKNMAPADQAYFLKLLLNIWLHINKQILREQAGEPDSKVLLLFKG